MEDECASITGQEAIKAGPELWRNYYVVCSYQNPAVAQEEQLFTIIVIRRKSFKSEKYQEQQYCSRHKAECSARYCIKLAWINAAAIANDHNMN